MAELQPYAARTVGAGVVRKEIHVVDRAVANSSTVYAVNLAVARRGELSIELI